jgi:hypothetical protein
MPGTSVRRTLTGMARPRVRGGFRWLALVAASLGLLTLEVGPDPTRIVLQAESFALRALDVSGRRHPIATFDGRGWLIDRPQPLVGPPSPDTPPIVGLETSEGVPVTTIRVFAASGEPWLWAERAVEAVALGAARLGDRRVAEVSMYVPAGAGASAVYVDLTMRSPEPEWRGVAVGAWVLPMDGASPVVLGARTKTFRSYDDFVRIPRRHPLGIAVAGRGGEQTWVMYNRSRDGDVFELAAVSRRGIREHPPIARGPS